MTNGKCPCPSPPKHKSIAMRFARCWARAAWETLAQDTSLNRRVALKVLPPEVASNHDRMRRFKQEASAAASLNHPSIAHIYEIGESNGLNFIAMEYVAGLTLRTKIHEDGEELPKLLRALQHVAEG